jgi:hypothetical protein
VDEWKLRMSLINTIHRQLAKLDFHDAVEILADFKAGLEGILVAGPQGNVASTPYRLLTDGPYSPGELASNVGPIIFNGGPLQDNGWYTGTMLSLVIDRMMRTIETDRLKLLQYERPNVRVQVRV